LEVCSNNTAAILFLEISHSWQHSGSIQNIHLICGSHSEYEITVQLSDGLLEVQISCPIILSKGVEISISTKNFTSTSAFIGCCIDCMNTHGMSNIAEVFESSICAANIHLRLGERD
jgi:hypothetical protein